MYNVVLAVVVSFGMVVKKVLVGTLTQLEIEVRGTSKSFVVYRSSKQNSFLMLFGSFLFFLFFLFSFFFTPLSLHSLFSFSFPWG